MLGVCLGKAGVPADFAARLQRARSVDEGKVRIIILGGLTRPLRQQTEAAAGRSWLIDRGSDPARVETEDASRNTLENLRAARQRLLPSDLPAVLITNRYHVHRSCLLAAGLGLPVVPCAAEDRFALTPYVLARMAGEAVFVTWYHVGRVTAHALGHRGLLARIS